MAHILRIDADSDLPTKYLKAFRDEFIFIPFDDRWPEHEVHPLIGLDACQPRVNEYLETFEIAFITGAGHGQDDVFTGVNESVIWHAGQDLRLLHGKIIHLLSCQAGTFLGRTMVKKGSSAFWGYLDKFIFLSSKDNHDNPCEDKVAALFIQMDCLIDKGILSSNTADKIYDEITRYVLEDSVPNLASLFPGMAFHIQPFFLENYYNLACPGCHWGDEKETL